LALLESSLEEEEEEEEEERFYTYLTVCNE